MKEITFERIYVKLVREKGNPKAGVGDGRQGNSMTLRRFRYGNRTP